MNTEEIKERIAKLSLKQKALLAYQLETQYIPERGTNGQNAARLVAYVVDDGQTSSDDLRSYLKERLPEYMVPAAYVQMDKFPRLPNGKIDSQALPDPEEQSGITDIDYVAPRTQTEQKLAAIWSEVLNFEPISIHDNFFEIGGDSILSIQIIAKANKEGMIMKPNALFEFQTIARLAPTVEGGEKKSDQQGTITGEMPLLPIQHWFFEEHQHAPHYWNQGLIFKNTKDLNPELLKEAIRQLATHHDALRLRFSKNAGKWQAHIAESKDINVFQRVDLTDVVAAELETVIKEKAGVIQSELNLSEGNLFKGVYFDCGESDNNAFLLFAHHLVVDAVSWGILMEDFKSICQQLHEGADVVLPPKTTSYKDWGIYLMQLAEGGRFTEEKEFWKKQILNPTPLPCDFETTLPITEAGCDTVNFTLDASATKKLRSKALTTYNTRMDEFLLAVLTRVLGDWTHATGTCFGLERHGREVMNDKIDLSNTVGWFTSYFPVMLTLEPEPDTGETLKSVKEQLRQIPQGGIGYGVLRYLEKQTTEEGLLPHHPYVIFNYLGQISPFHAGSIGTAEEVTENTRHPGSERFHILEINAYLQNDQLNVRWGYSRQLHLKDTINSLVQLFEKTLLNFIEHCNNPEAGGFTPSDFPEAGLNQDDLDSLLGEIDL